MPPSTSSSTPGSTSSARQQVTIRSGGQVIGTFAADSKTTKLVSFPVTAAQLGDTDMAEITLEVDKMFAPGGSDPRELGIRVFHAFVEPIAPASFSRGGRASAAIGRAKPRQTVAILDTAQRVMVV